MDRYAQLRTDRPELFRNDPDGIQILTTPAEAAAAEQAVHDRGGTAPVAAAQSGVVYADPYVTLLRDPVRFPGGGLGLHLRMLGTAGAPGVVVLPVLPDGVLLLEHYRHATRSWHLEAPRGYGEPGADDEQNARRELAEELGARADELLPLGRLHPDTGLVAGHVVLYAARLTGHGEVERAEGIRRAVRFSFAEAEQLVADGRITDGFTVAVLYRARLAGLLGGPALP
ncbi:ADP-ribose pyrophosphatase [Kitasatospora sp. GP30]|uniref:NUDIX hydrolase n=1 Tax=Kitasatospora sp. GP30 TaxID=3035084 RepID=UPI000C701EB4|nr:NUDIX hydrolase [Kitasatospora sp. GP30]MDH6145400.1 ADP-ribose pyrophosphatase [Kitasatospora sp. GP30]